MKKLFLKHDYAISLDSFIDITGRKPQITNLEEDKKILLAM